MKSSKLLSIESVALAGILIFGATGAVHAQGYDQGGSGGSGYDQGGSMQQPSGSTNSGTSGGGSGYGTSGTSQSNRYDSRTDGNQYGESSQGSRTYQDMELYDSDGSGGTGPKVKGRY